MQPINFNELSYEQIIELSNNQSYGDIQSIHMLLQESIRHYLSRFLSSLKADEHHPYQCYFVLSTLEDQGLSELEKITVTAMYQDTEGRIWILFEGNDDFVNMDECYLELLVEIVRNIEHE